MCASDSVLINDMQQSCNHKGGGVDSSLCLLPGKLQQLLSRSFSVASRAIRPTHRRIIKMLHAAGSTLCLSSHELHRGPSNGKRINLIVESFTKDRPYYRSCTVISRQYTCISIAYMYIHISFIVHCVARNDIDSNRRERK